AKVIFLFRERFWEDEGLLAEREDRFDINFLHSRRPPFPTWWTAAPSVVPMLTGWTGGPPAEKILAESDETIGRVALESLARLLRISSARLRRLVEAWSMHNWKRDPFSRGAYSFTGIGGPRPRPPPPGSCPPLLRRRAHPPGPDRHRRRRPPHRRRARPPDPPPGLATSWGQVYIIHYTIFRKPASKSLLRA